MKKFSFTINNLSTQIRLDHLLKERLSEKLKLSLSQAKIRKLIIAGRVLVNYRIIKIPSLLINNGMRIDLQIDINRLLEDGRAKDRAFVLSAKDILWEDDYLIAINKPPGLPTQPTLDQIRDNLFTIVKNYLAQRDNLTAPYLAIHQRLDRDTSGVIIFVKDERINAGLANIFAQHQLLKIYYAIVNRITEQSVPQNWEIKNYLAPIDKAGKQTKFSGHNNEINNSQFAHTKFKLLSKFRSALLIEAQLLTGRTHQIRVHLSEYGLPILGDTLYHIDRHNHIAQRNPINIAAPKNISAPRLMLHAYQLIFTHPINEQKITITAPLPDDFQSVLNRLK